MLWLEKDISKVENTLPQWILENILENQTFQRIAILLWSSDFYEMDFMKGIVILVKVNETYNIVQGLLATICWSRDEGEIGWAKFLLSLFLNAHTFTTSFFY